MALVNFSGIASGIDSGALIEALLDQERTARVTPLEEKATEYEETNSTLDELKEKLGELKTSAEVFRVINGGGLVKEAKSSNTGVASAVASNAAIDATYGVSVSNLAKNGVFSFNHDYASTTDAVDSSVVGTETVTVEVGSGASLETVNVDVSSSTTIADFVSQFNSQSSKATASLVNAGTEASPAWTIVISSHSTGLENGQINVSGYGAIGNLNTDGQTLDQASDASFTIDGISGSITRSSNTINDVIEGLTLSLESTGNSTITVSPDAETTTSNLQDFVDVYNEVVTFVAENDLVTQEQNGQEVENIFGPLASTSIDENILSSLRSALTTAGLGQQGAVNIFADLGVTTERDGTLKFDSETFSAALASDSEAVRSILQNAGETLASVNGTIPTYTRFNGLIDESMQSNQSLVDSTRDRISDIEKDLSIQEQMLTARYARLESLIGNMTSQQSALTSLLP